MRKYKKKLRPEVSDIICDICGKSCLSTCSMDDPGMAEYAVLEASWGYCSKKDGQQFRNEMCESCFDKVVAFLDSMK